MDATRYHCRLCLETCDDLVNIFDDFRGSPIASILTQHFWLQIHKNDGLSECLCHTCWTNIRTFHDFYKKIELLQIDYWNSVEKVSGDPDTRQTNSFSDFIKQERSASLETDLTLVKSEELSFEVIDEYTSKDESSDCARSENLQISENDSTHPIEKRDKKTKENQTAVPSKGSKSKRTTPCDNEMDAQIREFFTMTCDICTDNVEFETLHKIRRHYRTIHKQRGHITCCDKKFHRRFMILEHIQNHLNPDAHRCESCGKRFLDKRALKSHIANHEPRTSRAFKCSLCSSSFTNAVGLKVHMQNSHASEKGGKFPCDKCNKIFRSKPSLKTHFRFIHELVPTFVCDTCARAFKTKNSLLAHMQVHLTTPLPRVQCNICGAWLKNEEGLKQHRIRHDVMAVDCPICQKNVKNKLTLQRHILQVHRGRRHQCTLCDKAFKTRQLLKEHIAFHTGEDLYNCPYCEKTFKSNANMYAHRKRAHLTEWTRDHAEKVVMKET